MKRGLTYIPKKRKVNYKIVVPFVLVLLLALPYLISKFEPAVDPKDQTYTFCGFSTRESDEILEKSQKEASKLETVEVRDYGIYGETLNIYHEKYAPGNIDLFSGNTIFLKNLCQTSVEEKQPFLLSNKLDVGIDIMTLADGLYELEVLSDFKFKRLETESPIDDTFYSAKRGDVIKEIRILSDKDVFNKNRTEDKVLKNYLYFEVTTTEDNDDIDVVINPARMTTNDNGTIDYGHYYNDLEEATETYNMAVKIKKELEKHGVRIAILRDNETPSNNYSSNGRLKKAYDMNAKYMINLRFESSGSQMDHGVVALYSNFVSNRFAANVTKKLVDETSLTPSPYSEGSNATGVFETGMVQGLDLNDIIRESGGSLTGAGTLNEFSELTSFAKDYNRGINTIDLLYGYMTHPNDSKTWIEENDLIAEKTAQGILVQLGLFKSGEDSDN